MCNAAGEAAFANANASISQLTKVNDDPQNILDSVASISTRLVADGALTDNTGIAMLVANQKTDITAFIPYTTGYTPFQDLLQLFGQCSAILTDTVGVLLPVFEGDCEDVTTMVNTTFEQMPVVDGAKYLDSIRFGTMKLTTIEYKPLNIKAGTEVQVNAVLLASTLNMASAEMDHFGELVQEIVETFAQNKDMSDHILQVLRL